MTCLLPMLLGCSAQAEHPSALAPTAAMVPATAPLPAAPAQVRGVTISTPTYGPEWGSPAMASTLDLLVQTGVNWISYHPYARLQPQGQVVSQSEPPPWVLSPIEMAHQRGLKVMVKPHLAHWGSGFSWRGAILFEAPRDRARFWTSYRRWILGLAAACRDADIFVVGTELDQMLDEGQWRSLIAQVREVYPGELTYAANWDAYQRVPFWDALDYIGVQAYFPILSPEQEPSQQAVEAGWSRVLKQLDGYADSQGRRVLFTELGYDASPQAFVEPWRSGQGESGLQLQALDAALRAVEGAPQLRGVFLWKWFPGELTQGDFRLSQPAIQSLLRSLWGPTPSLNPDSPD